MAIVTYRTQVEEFFASTGLPVVDRLVFKYSRYAVPVAQAPGSRHYYYLVEGTYGTVEVHGRCPFRNVTVTASGDTYEEARLALRTAVAEYAALVTAAYLEI